MCARSVEISGYKIFNSDNWPERNCYLYRQFNEIFIIWNACIWMNDIICTLRNHIHQDLLPRVHCNSCKTTRKTNRQYKYLNIDIFSNPREKQKKKSFSSIAIYTFNFQFRLRQFHNFRIFITLNLMSKNFLCLCEATFELGRYKFWKLSGWFNWQIYWTVSEVVFF